MRRNRLVEFWRNNIVSNIQIAIYYIESRLIRLYLWLGFEKDLSVIPFGDYCYIYDEEKNLKEPLSGFSHWIKTCKYHRNTRKTGGVACAYLGLFGDRILLYDSCKCCGVNHGYTAGIDKNELMRDFYGETLNFDKEEAIDLVIEKIISLGYGCSFIGKSYVILSKIDLINLYSGKKEYDTKFRAKFDAVVEFIHWFNNGRKVVFLDIDGVISLDNSDRYDWSITSNLRDLYVKTGAYVVICSDQKTRGIEKLRQIFYDNHIDFKIIDVTVSAEKLAKINGLYADDIGRGDEIQYWLDCHPEFTQYVIIDDTDLVSDSQRSHFVKVDPKVGFSKDDCVDAIKILNG